MSGLEWTTPRIEEVPMDGRYRALYRQALEEEPVAVWEKDAFDLEEVVLAVVEEGDGCAVCIELEALIQTRRAVAAPAAPDPRLEEARAVRIEDEVARRGIKLRSGNERSGPCPVCGGDDRFAINVKKQLWNCRVCQHGGDVIALVRHLDGVGFEDAVATLSGRPAAKKLDAKRVQPSAKRIVIARFDYHNADGAVVYQVERVEYQNPDGSYVPGKDGKRKKDFPQRRPDPDRPGEWIYNLDDTRRVLYRLPELIEALAYGRTVVLVEGEAKADLLWSWNIPATCSPMGAKNWRGDLYAATLRGADIVVLPDNDPDGLVYLDAVAVSLTEVGASVRVLDLPVGPKGDVIDWERAGGTRERLDALIDNDARPWAPSERESENAGPVLALAAPRALTDRLPDIDFEGKPKARGNGQLEVNSEAFARNRPQQGEQEPLPPPPDRESLLLSAWLARDIPLRDYLLGGVMCTTSRWFIWGETGIGKTLIGMDMAAAMAAAANFLRWAGQRRSRVMYLDGELPVETFKERMQLIAARYGSDLQFYGYNRESLGFDGMPPLNTNLGQAWLRREIDAVKPDAIFFDSIMCLLIGSMLEEATWMPMRPFVRELTARRIAQIYFNHANEAGKSFGDKTREWEMDTTAKLSKPEGDELDETAIKFEFIKARLRTSATADQFKPMIIYPDNLRFEEVGKGGAPKRTQTEFVAAKFLEAYDRLADGMTKAPGFDGNPVAKVSAKALCEEMSRRGFLEKDEKGNVSSTGRSSFHRAKIELLKDKLQEGDGLIWRP